MMAVVEQDDAVIVVDEPWNAVLTTGKQPLEQALANYLPGCRWFRSKQARIVTVTLTDSLLMTAQTTTPVYLVLLTVALHQKTAERYVLFLTATTAVSPGMKTICCVQTNGQTLWHIMDAIYQPLVWQPLFHDFCTTRRYRGHQGELQLQTTQVMTQLIRSEQVGDITIVNDEQSNTAIIYGNSAFLKLYRCCDVGENPEVEISEWFSRQPTNRPRLAAVMRYVALGQETTIGMIQEYIANQGNAWQYSLAMLEMLVRQPATWRSNYAHTIQLLAQRSAQMHAALTDNHARSAFAAEPFTLADQQQLHHALQHKITALSALFAQPIVGLACDMQQAVLHKLIHQAPALIAPLLATPIAGKKIRCHGDYHLGQVLYTGDDLIIIDYEGEPGRSLAERKLKHSPLKDIAGMLRSFHYAIHTLNANHPTAVATDQWYHWMCQLFIDAYVAEPTTQALIPPDHHHFALLLKAYMLDKVIYELDYELNNRPQWINVPCNGLIHLLEG